MQGCQTHFHQGPHQPNVISTPKQLRSSYIYTVLKLFRPFEGSREVDVAPGEKEFDTPALMSAPPPTAPLAKGHPEKTVGCGHFSSGLATVEKERL